MTQERYSPQDIEQKWQERWQQQDAFACDHHSDKPKYSVLEMFPYPSGNIHMGHVRNYSIGDVVARCKRMQGFNVLHPMGWDAFGLPAENAAIKHNTHPARWTYANIDNMRAQLRRLPVTQNGHLTGMLSLADLARRGNFSMETAQCMESICSPVVHLD